IREIQLVPTYPVTLLLLRPENPQHGAPDTPCRQPLKHRVTSDQKLRHEIVSPVDLRPNVFQTPNRLPIHCQNLLTQQQLYMHLVPHHFPPGIRRITLFRSHSSHSNAGVLSASTSASTWFSPTLTALHAMLYGADLMCLLSINRPITLPRRRLKRFIKVFTPNST